ncbi:histidine kinase [Plantactinospora mayteni]|uniref:histidine kinase n=1 Tax=Plantactinospora mayteni TaxID=566021 RepID=A0ABQ4EL14_9ACTN|nr:histidine kinase [Plantactinospora mayteni]GIG95299.1 two-component sensor histidine kinase [Plantactinospora mayteni]
MSDGLVVGLPALAAWVVAVADGPAHGHWRLFGLAVAQSVALLGYRRFPLAVLVVVTGLELVLALVHQSIFVGVLVAVAGLGAWGRRRQQRLGIAFGLGVLLSILVFSLVTKGSNPALSASAFVVVAVILSGFWTIGRLGARQRGRIRELDAYSRRLMVERELAVTRAAERERVLLARELHDILNHAVTAMVLDADATAETGDAAEARVALRRIAETGRGSLAELRRLLGVLRSAGGDDGHDPLAVPPGLAQLDELVRAVPERGPRVRLRRCGTARPVAASVELAAYRVVQESLTNVVRHAGAVDVDVSITFSPGELVVRVSNTAPRHRRPISTGGGIGLTGMRERVQLVGGSFEAGLLPDGGFAVRALLPVQAPS